MTVVVAACCIAAFLAAAWRLRVMELSAAALLDSRRALALLSDRVMEEADRERAVQRASIELLITSLSVAARGALALLASMAPLVVADRVGLVTFGDVVGFLSRVDVIVGATVVVGSAVIVKRRVWPST